MFIATDVNGNRIPIENEMSGMKYYCPICGEEVYARAGDKVARHFAHYKACQDKWKYDISTWRQHMLTLAPLECRELVITHNGESHRADIVKDDMVILFQSYSISSSDLNERTKFFNDAGYRVAWVFNLTEQYRNKQITPEGRNKFINRVVSYKWKNPFKSFKNAPEIDYENKTFAIWIWVDMYFARLEHVISAKQNDKGEYTFSTFTVDKFDIIYDKEFDFECFFGQQQDPNAEWKEHSMIDRSEERYGESHFRYIGERGHKYESYQCPRKRQNSWIRLDGDNGCKSCKFCEYIFKCNYGYAVSCNYDYNLNNHYADLSRDRERPDAMITTAPALDPRRIISEKYTGK